VMDADLQHPPSLLPQMVQRWREGGWDVVEAVKSHRGRESAVHRVVARTFYRAASWLTGYDLQDASDFKLIDRRVLNEWRRLGERATFFRGLVAWLGFTRTQIAFEVPPRQAGESRWSFSALGGLAVHAVTSFSALPLQLVTVLGVVMLLVAVVIGAQAVRLWLQGLALPGFTTVILLQLIIGGFLMISLGVIGTYIARIYEEVKGRPRYVVRETRRQNRA
jgi:glycosyltransferase involved in cell wall biosynthesis